MKTTQETDGISEYFLNLLGHCTDRLFGCESQTADAHFHVTLVKELARCQETWAECWKKIQTQQSVTDDEVQFNRSWTQHLARTCLQNGCFHMAEKERPASSTMRTVFPWGGGGLKWIGLIQTYITSHGTGFTNKKSLTPYVYQLSFSWQSPKHINMSNDYFLIAINRTFSTVNSRLISILKYRVRIT